jgi:hypothetical protein
MNKDSLFTRTYQAEAGEEVVVIGNRKDISDNVLEVIEAEFIFRDGVLVDAHIVRFTPARETGN